MTCSHPIRLLLCLGTTALGAASDELLLPAATPAGYLARLLLNETPFPGEHGYVSEADSRTTFRALLLVIESRIRRIPPGYSRAELAATFSTNVLDVITAGGTRGQMDGFYRDERGRPAMTDRVMERVARLQRIARQGEPGRFIRLIADAQNVASDYLAGKVPEPDLFGSITYIAPRPVTGGAYAWMTDQEYYHPGGDFIRIPNNLRGRLGGNRFYTLRVRAAAPARNPSSRAPLVTLPK